MERNVAHPAEVLVARLTKNAKEFPRRDVRLDVRVDVAERSTESDAQSSDPASVAPVGVRADASLCLLRPPSGSCSS